MVPHVCGTGVQRCFQPSSSQAAAFSREPTVVDGSLRIADLSSQRSDQRRERQALQAISHAEMLLGTSVAIRSHLDLEHRNPTMAARAGRSLASIAHNTAGPVRTRYSYCTVQYVRSGHCSSGKRLHSTHGIPYSCQGVVVQ